MGGYQKRRNFALIGSREAVDPRWCAPPEKWPQSLIDPLPV
jgi:hypothetical protein